MMDLADFAALTVPAPTATEISRPFWEGATSGRLMLQQCDACARWTFYPRAICPHCWSPALTWREASGGGHLRTWSTQHRPGHAGWAPAAPYTIGLVGLDEGPTMLSHILVPVAQLRADLPLRVRFVDVGEWTLPCFEATP